MRLTVILASERSTATLATLSPATSQSITGALAENCVRGASSIDEKMVVGISTN